MEKTLNTNLHPDLEVFFEHTVTRIQALRKGDPAHDLGGIKGHYRLKELIESIEPQSKSPWWGPHREIEAMTEIAATALNIAHYTDIRGQAFSHGIPLPIWPTGRTPAQDFPKGNFERFVDRAIAWFVGGPCNAILEAMEKLVNTDHCNEIPHKGQGRLGALTKDALTRLLVEMAAAGAEGGKDG